MSKPIVSVIVTTKNNQATLGDCLASIAKQTYAPIELLVVDNHSTDDTLAIAKEYTRNIHTVGPERSAQRNYAVQHATGVFVLIIDSDMIVSPHVVADCVSKQTSDTKALIIPEESFGVGFWAKCKRLERSFYHGIDWIEAPRFFERSLYISVGGYDAAMSGGEDWDLHSRIKEQTHVGRVPSLIYHNEGALTLGEIIRSRQYYAKGFSQYLEKDSVKQNERSGFQQAIGVYGLLLSKPIHLLKNPLVGVGTLLMKTVEFATVFICSRRHGQQDMEAIQ